LDTSSQDSVPEVEQRLAPEPADLIRQLILGDEEGDGGADPDEFEPVGPPAPRALEKSLESPEDADSAWVAVEDEWVRVTKAPSAVEGPVDPAAPAQADEGELPNVVQRVIEVPYDRLRKGDLRYNVVIRPGDVIHVPAPNSGNVYLSGAVLRPGTYNLPGLNRLTIKQLMAAAGGFGPTGIPERVDLTRRIGTDHEATVRLNLRSIFHGTEPDIFLKPDDLLSIGTNFVATPLAVFRRGFRTSYGFGFILDRNFGPDVFKDLDAERRNFLRTN
jgi:hypothetical protein